jgi:hypothetical protein
MKVYVVTMYRWQSRENHSYVNGIYSTFRLAKSAAKKEQINRGGTKYYPEILAFTIDDDKMYERVHSLETDIY